MKTRKLNVKKISKLVLIIALILLAIFFITKNNKPPKPIKDPNVISEINGYELKDSASSYFKNIFNELITELSKEEIDENNYAKIISQLFIADCFTLSNKINHSDIGGTQFVYEPFREDFILIANETMYSSVENNVYGTRKQELPTVKKVEISSLEQKEYEYLETEDENAYYVTAKVEYTKDMDYPKEVSLILIHNNDKLEIAKLD